MRGFHHHGVNEIDPEENAHRHRVEARPCGFPAFHGNVDSVARLYHRVNRRGAIKPMAQLLELLKQIPPRTRANGVEDIFPLTLLVHQPSLLHLLQLLGYGRLGNLQPRDNRVDVQRAIDQPIKNCPAQRVGQQPQLVPGVARPQLILWYWYMART